MGKPGEDSSSAGRTCNHGQGALSLPREACPRKHDLHLYGKTQRATSGFPGDQGTKASMMVLIMKQLAPGQAFRTSGFLIYKMGPVSLTDPCPPPTLS